MFENTPFHVNSLQNGKDMCHIILLMPILSLVLFWIFPFSEAFPIYTAISIASGFIYLAIMRAMKRRSQIGPGSMIGNSVEVLKRITPGSTGQVLVGGEIWEAKSDHILRKGDRGKIAAVNGLTLKVRKV